MPLLLWSKGILAGNKERILEKSERAFHLQQNYPDSSLKLARAFLVESEEIGFKKGIGDAYVRIGSILNLKGKNDSALFYLEQAFSIRQSLKDETGAASTLRLIGYVYGNTGKLDEAYSAFLKSIGLIEKTQDTALIVSNYLEMAHFLIDYQEIEKAKSIYDTALNLAIGINDSLILSYCYGGLGKYHISKQEHKKALEYYLKAADLKQNKFSKVELAGTYNNIAVCYDYLEQYVLAKTFYKKALKIYKSVDFKNDESMAFYNIGICFYNQNKMDSAIFYLNQSAKLDSALKDIESEATTYLDISDSYLSLGNYEKAYAFSEKYRILHDSLLNASKIQSIAEMQTKYETEKKVQRIELLNQKNKAQQAERNFMLAISVVLLLAFIALGIYFIQRNRIAKRNARIAQQEMEAVLDEQEIKTYNAMLEGQEEERMRIATDLHDRLGSMLSTIKLMFSSLEEKVDKAQTENESQYAKANDLLDQACTEVRSISHNLGTGMVANFGLSRAMEELCESIDQTGKVKCRFLAHNLADGYKLETEINLYRITQEALNNAIKHAKAKSISVQLNDLGEELSLQIEDDGAGFEIKKVKATEGMGLGNLEKRAKKIGGTLHLDSNPGRGTTIIVEVPLNTETA
ncbi:MAG: tetratricopeptide repeat protein [Vicingaceae bacterium]